MSRTWSAEMGCLRAIVKRRKAKEEKSRLLKEQLSSEESNENHKDHHSSSNGSSSVKNDQQANAATRIQAAFRSFLARKVLHSLKGTAETRDSDQDRAIATTSETGGVKGTVRFREDHTAKAQATSALNHIHSWSRIQEQIRVRRLCMVQEARVKRKKLENQLKLEAKLHELEVEWCGGSETMEEIVNRIQQREEASIKRERAMAYAFVHQWRANSSQYLGQTSFSLGKESWGWSWVERWVAARPWEIRVVSYPANVKKPQTKPPSRSEKLHSQPENKVSATQDPTASNESCKNRKTCSTHPTPS